MLHTRWFEHRTAECDDQDKVANHSISSKSSVADLLGRSLVEFKFKIPVRELLLVAFWAKWIVRGRPEVFKMVLNFWEIALNIAKRGRYNWAR